MPKHQKHAKIARLPYGEFHLNEWGVLGAPCGIIQQLTAKLIEQTAQYYRLAYVDADHAAADEAASIPVPASTMVHTDKINFQQYDFATAKNSFQQRTLFQEVDGVLINGNHFRAKRQIVILDPRKEDSLRRKLDRLTDVALILTTPEQTKPYDFLVEQLGDQVPVMMPLGDVNGILQWLRAQLTAQRPPVYGLVLAGGKSQRMGQDKGLIDYHGLPQRDWVAQLLAGSCEEVFFSVRTEQENLPKGQLISDSFTGLGPFGAILSAFREHPQAAWLVVACDMPLLDQESIQFLLQQRSSSHLATAFHNPVTSWPDPLLTVWEPRAYPTLLQFLAQGYSCPRKVLINSDVKVLQPPNAEILRNANSPEERKEIEGILPT